ILLTGVILSIAVIIYTMGGFGGGSIFVAILLLSGTAPSQAAVFSLLFNIISTGTSLTRWRIYLERKFTLFSVGSIPFSFIGGLLSLTVQEYVLKMVMGVVIAFSGLFILISSKPLANIRLSILHIIFIGCLIGFIAGLTGIGGGVYLAPILLLDGISDPKATAATTTFFIFSNSLAGLLARTERMHVILQNQILLLLLPIVVISAIVGGHIGSRMLSREKVKKIIGAILTGIGLFIAFYQ
ncbi:MAG: sulfite exporter TauE/SafE family protein, partial [Nitrososphaerota archaeon]